MYGPVSYLEVFLFFDIKRELNPPIYSGAVRKESAELEFLRGCAPPPNDIFYCATCPERNSFHHGFDWCIAVEECTVAEEASDLIHDFFSVMCVCNSSFNP